MSARGRTALVGLFAALLLGGAGPGAGPGSGAGRGARGGARSDAAPAGAAPAPEWIAVPGGWRPMAELVPAGQARAGEGAVRADPPRAYGDPASGCFALLQRVSAPVLGFDQARAIERLVRDLQAAGFQAGPGASELPFAGHGFEGRMRVVAAPDGGDRIALRSAACFYNGREPDRCRAACQAMLDSAGATR